MKENKITEDQLGLVEEVLGSFEENIVKPGFCREMENFKFIIDENLSLVVSFSDGTEVKYPFLANNDGAEAGVNKSWYYIVSWMVQWNESAQKALASFVSYVVYPSIMSLSFDEVFIGDIKSAVTNAIEREQSNRINGEQG